MTAPDQEPEGRDRPAVVIICTTVLALAVLGLYGWQQATGHDTGTTLMLLAGVLGAGGFGIASYTRNTQVQRDVTAVRHQTNGNTSRLLDLIEQQNRLLAQAGPVAHAPAPGADGSPEVPAAAPVPPTP